MHQGWFKLLDFGSIVMRQDLFWTYKGTTLELHTQECCVYMQCTLCVSQLDSGHRWSLIHVRVGVNELCIGVSNDYDDYFGSSLRTL